MLEQFNRLIAKVRFANAGWPTSAAPAGAFPRAPGKKLEKQQVK